MIHGKVVQTAQFYIKCFFSGRATSIVLAVTVRVLLHYHFLSLCVRYRAMRKVGWKCQAVYAVGAVLDLWPVGVGG